MAREKVADIRIRARDESGPALQKAKAALDAFNQAAQRAAARRQTIGVRKEEIDGIRQSYTRLTGDMRRLQEAQDRMRASGTATQSMLRENGEAIALVRNRAREAVAALAAKRAELQRLGVAGRNSFAAFSKNADAIQRQTRAARDGSAANSVQSAAARQTADALGQLSRRTSEASGAQTKLRGQMAQTTSAMAAQSTAMRGRTAAQNWGSPVIGEAQDVMAFGLRPYQLTNLSYQVNDVVSGIAMGQPIMQIFAQQVGQILQIFPAFARGMMSIFKLFERFKLLTGLVGLGIGGFITAIVRVKTEARDTEAALTAAANDLQFFADSANYTVEGMGNAALAIRAYAGDLGKALEITRAFAQAGIRETRFEDLAAQASQFARATGLEIPDAASRLADAFSGGFGGIRELDKEFNFLSRAALETARSLFETGQVAEAQEFIFDQLSESLTTTTTQAAGPWSAAFTALGSAWNSFVTWLSDTAALRSTIYLLDRLGNAVRIAAEGIDYAFSLQNEDIPFDRTLVTIEQLFRMFFPIARAFPDSEEEFLAFPSVDELRAALSQQDAMITEAQNDLNNMVAAGSPAVASQNAQLREMLAERELLLQALSDAQSGTGRTAGLPSEEAASPGITQEQLEEIGKSYDDLRAKIAEANAERAQETALVGLSTREGARQIALREAYAAATELGAQALADFSETWAETERQIIESVDAHYDAIEAQERLTAATQAADSIIERTRTTREQNIAVIQATEEALAELAAEYERTGDPAIAAQIAAASAALGRFKASARSAAGGARELRAAALDLRDAMATIGSFNADLDARLVNAQNQIAAIRGGISEIRLDAEQLALVASREIIASGGSVDQAAAAYSERLERAEATLAAERQLAELRRKTFNPPSKGGGGGGDSPSDEERNRLEEELNGILEYRTALLAEIKYQEEQGNTSEVARLTTELGGVNESASLAIDNMIAFLETLTGAEIEAAILNLQRIQRGLGDIEQKVVLTGKQANDMLADGVASGFDRFSQDIANGEKAIKSLRDAFLQFAADFLRQIAQMIIKQAALNLLQGSGGEGGGVGGFIASAVQGLFRHEGGMANSGGGFRTVNPAIFAGAARFHGGGIAGLGPREVPAILMDDEEVLTADDPRHARNGGGAGNVTLKNVNVFDPADMLERALSTAAGERVLINHINRNSRQYKGALG